MAITAMGKVHKVHPNFHGKKGLSGRKKSPRNVIKYLTEHIDDNWSKLVDSLIQKAINGDKELLQYCFDRRLGKPKQSTDLDISGGEELSASLVTHLFAMLATKRKELEQQDKLQIEKTGAEDVVE